MRLTIAGAVLTAMIALSTPHNAAAEVVERGPDHFILRYEAATATPGPRIAAAVGAVDRWWDGAHTYSGDAANLTLPLKVGACFCEAMPNGEPFQHGRVLETGEMGVMLDAPLGPLKDKAALARLGFAWAGVEQDWVLVMTFIVRGPGVGAMADGVDQVMKTQFARLTAYVDADVAPASDDVTP